MSKLRIFVAFDKILPQTFCIRSLYETILNNVRRQKWIGFRNPTPSQTTGKKMTHHRLIQRNVHTWLRIFNQIHVSLYYGNMSCQASKKELKIHRFLAKKLLTLSKLIHFLNKKSVKLSKIPSLSVWKTFLVFSIEKFESFLIQNWLWKSNICTFWRLGTISTTSFEFVNLPKIY